MVNYGITEDGKLVLEDVCEDGKFQLGGAITEDGRLISIFMLFSAEAGSGIDAEAVEKPINVLCDADVGTGVDRLQARLLGSSDVGAGVDAISGLLATLSESDEGIGVDEWSALLAEIEQSDIGTGVEDSTVVVLLYLLLKLLQTKEISMKLSNEKLLNMKLSQRQQGE